MKSIKWRSFVILGLTLWAVYAITPTIIYFMQPPEIRSDSEAFSKLVPDFFPKKHVALGLDLQGGQQLVLGVDTNSSLETRLNQMAVEIKRWSDDNEKGVKSAYVKKGDQRLTVTLEDGVDSGSFNEAFRKEYSLLFKKGREQQSLYYGFDEKEIQRIGKSATEQAERVVRNRIDRWGVSEPSIFRRSDGSILVQLPGFKNPEKAKQLLGKTAQLAFQIVDDEFKGFVDLSSKLPEGIKVAQNGGSQLSFESEDRDALTEFLKPHVPDDRALLFSRESIGDGSQGRYRWISYVMHASIVLNGSDVQDATVGQSNTIDRKPSVFLTMTGPGGRRLANVTEKYLGKRMAVVLDNVVEQAPVIQSKIPNGRASISLGSSESYSEMLESGNQLAMILKSGAIPATINIMEQREVGATLGPELANQGIKGILIGLSLVLLFMLLYYRKPGFIACLALTLNAVFMLAIMAGFGFALTLPGIAGFILTLGMAVDANVLINERIRQEIKDGKNPKKSIQVGFDKVFWTIIDANITTLIAALVLLETSGSGPIRGFAITLMIGLIVSLFTSLYCSRFFFDFVTSKVPDNKIKQWLLGGVKTESKAKTWDFLQTGRMVTIFAVFVAISIFIVGMVRGVNLGVDFSGGTEVLIGFSKNIEPDVIRSVADKNSIEGLSVQALDGGQTNYLIRYDENKQDAEGKVAASSDAFLAFKESLLSDLKMYQPKIHQVDFVGPQVGKELRNQGIISVLYAILAVLLYIGLRFDMRFGPGAIIKMFLDIILMLGFYVFYEASFDLVAVAAFLTVVGYSVNDTIVIYDRIRENMVDHPRRSLKENINVSLNETLSRTINTSLTTVASLIGVLFFGTGQIWYFAMAMMIGVIVASISSTFIASSFILWLEQWREQKRLSTTAPRI